MLLARLAEYLRSRPNDGLIHVVREGGAGEDPSLPEAEPKIEEAAIVEGDGVEARPVGRPESPRFVYFLDGIERRHLAYYHGIVPILYGFTGAVIRRRGEGRRMSTFDALSGEKLYLSCPHVDSADLIRNGIAFLDVGPQAGEKSDSAEAHPIRLLELARRAVSRDRETFERELVERWIKSAAADNGWLLWDGSITVGFEAYKHPRVVGVVKSHQTQYFGAEDQRKILGLAVGERSSVFRPAGRERTPVYSWYLRLHSNAGRDVYFGLVRLEAAATDETIRVADQISRWLLGERSPLSLPDGRWDRMLYPIRDCEQYLRSIAPSNVVIESALAGVGV